LKLTKAILLVGGEGTRLRPLTLNQPKPMLPVAGLPITAHQIAKLVSVGVNEVVLATSYQAAVFSKWLATQDYLDANISVVVEENPLGTGGAIRNAADYLNLDEDESVVVLNGDVLSGHNLANQITQFKSSGWSASIHLVTVTNPAAFGLVPTDKDARVLAFLEKPTSPEQIITNQINAGCYLLSNQVIRQIAPGTPCSVERDVFPKLLQSNFAIAGYLDDSYFLDLGTPYSYIQGSADLVQQNVYSPLIEFKQEALIHPDAKVAEGAVVYGGSVVAAGAEVGKDAVISGSVLENNSKVGDGVQLFDSYLGKNSRIENQLSLTRVVIGDDCLIKVEIPPGVRVWPNVTLVIE